ncbi:MAG: DUF3108 domain-containing protein [Cellvibrionaceae bacterium]
MACFSHSLRYSRRQPPLSFLLALAVILPSFLLSSYSNAQVRTLYKNTYSAKVGGLTLSAEQELKEIAPGEFEVRTTFDHFLGSIIELGRFYETEDKQLRSLSYFYKRVIFGKKKEDHINIDWPAKKAFYRNHKGSKREFDVPNTVVDKASQVEAVRRALEQGKQSFDVSIIERKGVRHSHFKVLKEETIKVKAGTFKAIKIEKIRDLNAAGPQRETRFWMASHKGSYVLVKMEQVETDGKHYEMELSKLG